MHILQHERWPFRIVFVLQARVEATAPISLDDGHGHGNFTRASPTTMATTAATTTLALSVRTTSVSRQR
jgi:hypothetical protein